MAVQAPTDKRFHRAQVQPARSRRASWRRLVQAAVMAAVLAAAADQAIRLLGSAPLLHIDTITVDGHTRLSTGEVLALVGDLKGAHMLTVDLEAERRKLMSAAWVKDATLRRVLPSTIDVVIVERTPVGLGRFGDRLYLVDERGRIIDEYGPNFADLDFPIIEGLSPTSQDGDLVVDERRAALATRLIREVSRRADLAERISQVDVRDPYDAVVLLSGDPALLHLGRERFLERLEAYLELAPALRARVADIDYVDLRFDQRVYVRPAQ
jgi:cell division protein FtsQ